MRSDSEIIALAWDDKASFEMIEDQTGINCEIKEEEKIIAQYKRDLY